MNNKIGKILSLIPDELYLKMRYRMHTGLKLNLKNPTRFNEKLQWLKLYNRHPEYTVMVDKVKVKEYVANLIGEKYIIPTLGVWERVEDIDFDALPDKFVIKCNHNSGKGMYICTDKSKMDVKAVKKGLCRGLEQDYYLCDREWPYKNVPRRIIAEKFMTTRNGCDLIDYKIHCFNGKPKFILVCSDRFSGLKEDFYDINWKLINVSRPKHPNSENGIQKPLKLNQMLNLAEILAKNIPFVRVDFYEIQGEVYFGEITFFPATGYGKFNPDKYDKIFGDMITLPKKKIK